MKKFKVGVQLYSVRDDMEKDFYGTLKAIKEAGYDYVEFAGYYGYTAEQIRGMLDELGLECISVHQGPEGFIADPEGSVRFLNVIGAKFCAIPWYPIDSWREKFDETIEMFKQVSRTLAKGGIRMTYHNHDFEFEKIDGEHILDRIFAAMDGEIEGEVDTCWAHYAGVNPAEYILKYKGQLKTLHLKDFECERLAAGPVYALIDSEGKAERPSREGMGFRFRPVGSGRQNFAEILAAAEEVGIDYVIVEQDEWYEQGAIAAATESRRYLRETFGI